MINLMYLHAHLVLDHELEEFIHVPFKFAARFDIGWESWADEFEILGCQSSGSPQTYKCLKFKFFRFVFIVMNRKSV